MGDAAAGKQEGSLETKFSTLPMNLADLSEPSEAAEDDSQMLEFSAAWELGGRLAINTSSATATTEIERATIWEKVVARRAAGAAAAVFLAGKKAVVVRRIRCWDRGR